MLCGDLEGWDGGVGMGEAHEGRDICIIMANLHFLNQHNIGRQFSSNQKID